MSLRKDTINGKRLAAKWGITIYELSYRILKYDLSVLNPPRIPILKLFFNPKNFRIDSDKILEIIRSNPRELYDKLFFIDEIEKIRKKINSASLTKTKSASPAFDSKAEGNYYSSNSTTKKALKPHFNARDIAFGKKKKTNSMSEAEVLKFVIEDQEDDIKKNSNVFSLIGKAR